MQVLPHQFVGRTAAGIKDVVAEGCVSCSLVKGGIDIKPEGMELCSEATPRRNLEGGRAGVGSEDAEDICSIGHGVPDKV